MKAAVLPDSSKENIQGSGFYPHQGKNESSSLKEWNYVVQTTKLTPPE